MCFYTSKEISEATKISKEYFGEFNIVDTKKLSDLAVEKNEASSGKFLLITHEICDELLNSISHLVQNADFSLLPILIFERDFDNPEINASVSEVFKIILPVKTGYGQVVSIIEMIVGSGQLKFQLAESERKYNALVNNLPGITYRCKNDSDWTMLYMSRKMEKLTGYPVRSFINNKDLTFSDIIVPQDREHVWLCVQKALKKNLSFTLEYRIKTAKGRIKWVWEQGRQVVDKNGEIFLEGVIMDIDYYKNLEQRIELMRHMVLAINASSDLPDLIEIIKNELGKVIIAGDFKLNLFDWDKREFLVPCVEDGREYYKKIPMSKTLDALVIKRNRSIFFKKLEIFKLHRQGKIIQDGPAPEVWLGVPIQRNGKSSGVIVLQDFESEFAINSADIELLEFVSVQVGAVLQKKQAQDETLKLLQAVEQSPLSAMITDLDGYVVYANQKAANLLGKSLNEILGKIPNIINPYKSETEHYSNVWAALRKDGAWQGEYKNTNAAGEVCWEHAFISSIKNVRNKTTHYLYLKEEITERKQIEIELRKAKLRAEESDKLKTAFLANISHEIRTPMNAIIGFTEMLRTNDYSKDDHEEFFDLIIENSKKLLSTIGNIIDIAKIEAGQMSVSSSMCSANKILYDNFYTFEKLKEKLDRTQIKFIPQQYIIDENLLFMSDPVRIYQVLENILGNAFKYTSSGSIIFGYTLLEKGDEKFINFYVKDSGMGISEQKKEHIFNRFTQASNNYMNTAIGSGLGLSISRNIARLLGGDILMESTPGKGSEFHFLIPYIRVNEFEFSQGSAKVLKEKTEMEWPDKTVLITEDEDSNFKLLEIMLRKTRVKIERAFNGKQAVNYVIGGNDVDLILMDVRMPVMNGYEATEHIKKFNQSIPVIIQTAFALKGDRENSFGAGCDEYLSKPIKATELYGLLKKFLG